MNKNRYTKKEKRKFIISNTRGGGFICVCSIEKYSVTKLPIVVYRYRKKGQHVVCELNTKFY